MFANFSQQLKKSTKPASTLLEMNAKTLELVSKQQTVFFSGVMTDSVKLLDTLLAQTEMKGIVAAQSVYAESVKERLTSASKTTYGGLSTIGKDAAIVIKDSLESAGDQAKEAVGKALSTNVTAPLAPAAAKPVTKKVATKKPAAKPVAKEVAAKKPVAKKPAATQATAPAPAKAAPVTKTVTVQAPPPVIEKPVSTKTPAKTVAPKKAAVAKKNPAKAKPAKAAATKKPVAKLSPADVKAENTKPE